MVELDPLLRRDAVMAALGVRPTTLDNMLASGELPPPIKVTGNVKAWPKSIIIEFIESRKAAARDDAF